MIDKYEWYQVLACGAGVGSKPFMAKNEYAYEAAESG